MGHSDVSGPFDPAVSHHSSSVAEGAEGQLRSNAYLALKNVSCDYHDGVLTLRGCLPSYFLKQMAQTAVARLDGVRQVVNEIVVVTATSHRQVWGR
jgi:osmotically-inducible protein OsmY